MKKIVIMGALLAAVAGFAPDGHSAGKWPGVDEVVVQKFAKEAGRPARDPYINTDQGDLLLLMFLLAGVAGGFAIGYYYRQVFSPPPEDN